MNRIRTHSLGLAFAIFLAFWHTLWSFLVWTRAAQWLLDFVFRLHMITPPYKVAEFDLGYAIGLVALTAAWGYIVGSILALIWNAAVGKVKPS